MVMGDFCRHEIASRPPAGQGRAGRHHFCPTQLYLRPPPAQVLVMECSEASYFSRCKQIISSDGSGPQLQRKNRQVNFGEWSSFLSFEDQKGYQSFCLELINYGHSPRETIYGGMSMQAWRKHAESSQKHPPGMIVDNLVAQEIPA